MNTKTATFEVTGSLMANNISVLVVTGECEETWKLAKITTGNNLWILRRSGSEPLGFNTDINKYTI